MHPYLTRLGIRAEVQDFFAPYWSPVGHDLVFEQDGYREHFGLAFHRVETGGHLWIGGETNPVLAQRAFIGASVMEMVAFLHYQGQSPRLLTGSIFIVTGGVPSRLQLNWIAAHLKRKALMLLFPADLLGAITDLKIAASLRGLPAAAFLAEKESVQIYFRTKCYDFDRQAFSLSAFEKATGFRFNVSTRKSKKGASFLDQLMAGAFPTT